MGRSVNLSQWRNDKKTARKNRNQELGQVTRPWLESLVRGQGLRVGIGDWEEADSNEELRSRIQERASLVVQWLRVRLPMQGTWVRALVWEDPTCRGATGPMNHNY